MQVCNSIHMDTVEFISLLLIETEKDRYLSVAAYEE